MNARGGRTPYETRQRQIILRALATAAGFLSAQALHEHLRLAGERIALTTVYRALHSYARAGRIDTTFDAAGEQLFHAGRGHYLVCRACGRAISIDASTVTDWAEAQAADHGFIDVHPIIELAGLCPECAGDHTWAPGRSSDALSSA